MPGRPVATILAVGLLLVIGLSGLAVGIQLFAAMWSPTVASLGVGPKPAGALLFTGIAMYGALATAGGVGTFARKRWSWRVAAGTIVAGLAILAGVLTVTRPALVTLRGFLILGVTLTLLLVPGTRRAMAD